MNMPRRHYSHSYSFLATAAVAIPMMLTLWASTTPASADVLGPGGSGMPDNFGAISGSVEAGGTITNGDLIALDFTAVYTMEVVADSSR